MGRLEQPLKAKLLRSIHGIPHGSTVTVVEYNKASPCVVLFNGKEYKVNKDNLDIQDL